MAKKTTTKKKRAPGAKARGTPQKRVGFTYDAPDASAVTVTGSFCGWDEGVSLQQDGNGRWKGTLTLPRGDYEYRFRVDGEWRDDPNCAERTPNRYGTANCVIHV